MIRFFFLHVHVYWISNDLFLLILPSKAPPDAEEDDSRLSMLLSLIESSFVVNTVHVHTVHTHTHNCHPLYLHYTCVALSLAIQPECQGGTHADNSVPYVWRSQEHDCSIETLCTVSRFRKVRNYKLVQPVCLVIMHCPTVYRYDSERGPENSLYLDCFCAVASGIGVRTCGVYGICTYSVTAFHCEVLLIAS